MISRRKSKKVCTARIGLFLEHVNTFFNDNHDMLKKVVAIYLEFKHVVHAGRSKLFDILPYGGVPRME